jgi:DNA-binding NtrC family response regulator
MEANFARDVLDSVRGIRAEWVTRGGLEDVKSTVLIVDDDVSVRESLEMLVRSAGWQVKTFASAEAFLSNQHHVPPCCVVLDQTLPGITGLDLQQRLAERPDIPIIFMTGHADVPMTVRAMKSGAFEFLTKPVADDVLLNAIGAALERSGREHAPADGTVRDGQPRWRSTPQRHDSVLGGAPIGTSAQWRAVLKQASQVAATEATTCLQGESGTGKEVVARFIHRQSPRRRGPFIAINCAALPEHLLESELFGFERGAFTGAQQLKPGQIELASGGVLFLDEVTEMTPAAQAKFLRVLQEREFVRLGGTRAIKANVRVIAATNRDLREAVAEGQFRADLYYRLNVFDIHIPPLRQRPDDIPMLVASFLGECHHAAGRPVTVTTAAMDALRHHDWPGNVRELRNVIERASIVCEDGVIRPGDLMLCAAASPTEVDSTDLEVIERRTIVRVMREANGNKVQASRKLGISRTQLYMRLRKYGLESPAVDVEAPVMQSEFAAG